MSSRRRKARSKWSRQELELLAQALRVAVREVVRSEQRVKMLELLRRIEGELAQAAA